MSSMEQKIIQKDFVIQSKLGAGAFGQVFKAIQLSTSEEVAIKFQPIQSKSPQLFSQAKILQIINDKNNDKLTDHGIPRVMSCAVEGQYNVMIMDLLGLSLEQLFTIHQKFDMKTSLMLAIQMLTRIKRIHSKNIIHRDIKPDNFVLGGMKKSYKLYLIDFGLAKSYIQRDGSHISYKDTKNLTGTARYASLNTHLGIQQSRRDDLQGIANVLIYFAKGSIPWQNLKAANKKQKYEKIMQKKLSVPLDKLCSGLPPQFLELINYARTLQFQQKPDYDYLINLFMNRLKELNYTMDYQYCWGSLSQQMYDFSQQIN